MNQSSFTHTLKIQSKLDTNLNFHNQKFLIRMVDFRIRKSSIRLRQELGFERKRAVRRYLVDLYAAAWVISSDNLLSKQSLTTPYIPTSSHLMAYEQMFSFVVSKRSRF
jgi:hypothetical protein